MKISEAISDTFHLLNKRRNAIFRGVILPSVLIIIFQMTCQKGCPIAITLALSIVNMVAYIYIAIVVHRCILIGSESFPPWGIGAWSNRETSFFFYSLGIGFITIIPCLILSFLILPLDSGTPMIFRMLPGLYLMARLSLVFPSIAVDKDISFRESWKLTKKHHLLVVLLVGLVPLLLNLPTYYLPDTPLTMLFKSAYGCITAVIIIALLSKAYSLCVEQGGAGNGRRTGSDHS